MVKKYTNLKFKTSKTEKETPKTQKSIVPVSIKECRNVIYNLFEDAKYTKLSITKKAYVKLMCYINLIGDYEISGFGRIQDGIITDFRIIKQNVKHAYVESDEDSILEFIRSIDVKELPEWELDWHSHVNMSVSPSGTDWDNYESMSKLRGSKQFPIMVVNKEQDLTLMNYISKSRCEDIELEFTEEEITREEVDEIYNNAAEDIKKYCSREIEVITTPSTYNYNTDDYYSSYIYNGYYCKSCGTELLTPHEFSVGLCEDCEKAAVSKKGEPTYGRL